MLQRLQIRNYAIIDELDIEFQRGLNIITGETGAGKSILMGALGLVLGNRADSAVLFDEGEKCIVEATFLTRKSKALSEVLASLDLDEEETLLVRREIAPNGKSRSFVNDTPVTLQGLKAITCLVVDLHRQFETLALGEDSFQFDVLDALANQQSLVKQYRENYIRLKAAEKSLEELKEEQEKLARDQDYTRFLYNELEEMNLQPGEIEALEGEAQLLSNAEEIKSSLEQMVYAFEENDPSLVQQIKQISNQLGHLGAGLPELTGLRDRLLSLQIELQDISRELSKINDRIGLDPQRLQWVQERLSGCYRLMKKHGATHTGELLELQARLAGKLESIGSVDEKINQLAAEVAQMTAEVLALGQRISAERLRIIPSLEQATLQYLNQMGMPNARLRVTCKPASGTAGEIAPGVHGIDRVSFLFDANKTDRFEPLEKVASGGELSRLMLAIKAQVARSIKLPALIFDEIDTGISGEAARQVGLLLKQLAGGHQVICITHQPQIAARANAHYLVYKMEASGEVKTRVRILEMPERIDILAQMLSGERVTESARQIAREMVES